MYGYRSPSWAFLVALAELHVYLIFIARDLARSSENKEWVRHVMVDIRGIFLFVYGLGKGGIRKRRERYPFLCFDLLSSW